MIDTSIDPEVYRSATGDLIGVVLLALLLFAMFLGYLRRQTRKGEGLESGKRRLAEPPGPPQGEPEPSKAEEEIRKAA